MVETTGLNKIFGNFSQEEIERIVQLVGILVGDKSNLKINFHEVGVVLGSTRIAVDGKVGLDIDQELVPNKENSQAADNMTAEKIEAPIFESGRISIQTGDLSVVEVSLVGKRLDVDFEDKGFLKRVIKIGREFGGIGNVSGEGGQNKPAEKKDPLGGLASIRTLAEALDKRGFTVRIFYTGGIVVVLGSEATPTLLQLVTKTRAIAVKNFIRLVRMIM